MYFVNEDGKAINIDRSDVIYIEKHSERVVENHKFVVVDGNYVLNTTFIVYAIVSGTDWYIAEFETREEAEKFIRWLAASSLTIEDFKEV